LVVFVSPIIIIVVVNCYPGQRLGSFVKKNSPPPGCALCGPLPHWIHRPGQSFV
jgi:hypothetical protein